MKTETEKRNHRISLTITVIFHTVLLIIFIFIIAWKAPYPPLAEFGVEINFGTTDAGTGVIQPESVVDQNLNPEDALPEEKKEDVQTQPETSNQKPEETVTESEPVKEPVKDKLPESVSTPEESPVSANKSASFPKVDKKKTETKTEKSKSGSEGKKGNSPEEPGMSQGDKTNTKGDLGDPKGKIDSKSLYGKPGQGGNFLEMTGWGWANEPVFNDKSPYSGKIVFQIKIDSNGEIISVKSVESSVPQIVVDVYKKEIEKATFVPTRDNLNPAPASVGKYTVIIKAK